MRGVVIHSYLPTYPQNSQHFYIKKATAREQLPFLWGVKLGNSTLELLNFFLVD